MSDPRHDHDDDHDHDHDHTEPPADMVLRVKALESLLVEKQVIDRAALDELVDAYEHRVGPRTGAMVVAHAWSDPDFRARLLADASAAVATLDIHGPKTAHLKAVENTPTVHNMIVCTLCSCYPWSMMGLPPTWYKSKPYRSRVVLDPRSVLREFGTEVPESTEIRVWDSTSELRYFVLPMRPAGTEGWSEEQLATLVSRNSMVGVEPARDPESGA